MEVFVSGSLAYDIILDYPGRFADHIDPKKIHALSISFLLDKLERSIGGTAGNIAYNLAMLKMPVKLLGSVGEDGREILKRYKDMSIDINLSKISNRLHTAAAFIITDQMDNQIAGFYPGAMNEIVKLPKAKPTDWAIIAAEKPGNMARLAKHYAKNKVKYIFDPGQQSIALSKAELAACFQGANIMIGNDYEIDYVFRKIKSPLPNPPPPDFAKATTGTRGEGIKNNFLPLDSRRYVGVEGGGKVGVTIIRTLGPKGSEVLFPNGKKVRIGIAKAKKAVDPTGAGDAYRAGLIAGIVKGFDLKRSAQLGATAAAFAVEKYGTQNHKFSYDILIRRHNRNFKDKI